MLGVQWFTSALVRAPSFPGTPLKGIKTAPRLGWEEGGSICGTERMSSFMSCVSEGPYLYYKTEAFKAELFVQVGSSAFMLTTKVRMCTFTVEKCVCALFNPGCCSTGKTRHDSRSMHGKIQHKANLRCWGGPTSNNQRWWRSISPSQNSWDTLASVTNSFNKQCWVSPCTNRRNHSEFPWRAHSLGLQLERGGRRVIRRL